MKCKLVAVSTAVWIALVLETLTAASKTFEPRHYDLFIEPDLKQSTFRGRVSIEIECSGRGRSGAGNGSNFGRKLVWAASKLIACGTSNPLCNSGRSILLNVGKSIQLDEIRVSERKSGKESSLKIKSICYDPASEMLAINLRSVQALGSSLAVEIDFQGQMGTNGMSSGFYKSDDSNANTHFFPADARLAFPSFDQPDMKATFRLQLLHDKELTALSNTAVESQVERHGNVEKLLTSFKQTPRMPISVFGFALGQYEAVKRKVLGIDVTAYAPIGRSHQAHFTLATVAAALEQATQFFGIPYPLEKLDLVVTKYGSTPARENWGLLTFIEDFLLTDADTTNVLRVEIAKLAVHVTLHQWWGNLVGAGWWDDQWIFDGFTTWQSHRMAATIYPEFSYDFNYLTRLQSPTLDFQSNATIAQPVKSDERHLDARAEIDLFGQQGNNKAAAFYNMLSATIGDETFRNAIGEFVRRFQYKVGSQGDFIKVLSEFTGEPVADMVSSYIEQLNVPFLEAMGEKWMYIRQSRLVFLNRDVREHPLWTAPIVVECSDCNDMKRTEQSKRPLPREKEIFDVEKLFGQIRGPSTYSKFNPAMKGFRIHYSDELFKRLRRLVKERLLAPIDRFNLINVFRALVMLDNRAFKKYAPDDYLDWFAGETDGGVLSGLAMALPVFKAARMKLQKERYKEEDFRETVFRLFGKIYEQSKLEVRDSESMAQKNGRQDALMALVEYNHQQVVSEALQVFESSDVHLAPFLRRPVYLAVILWGSDQQFDSLLERLKQTRSAYELRILVKALEPYSSDERNASLKRLLT